MATRVVGLDIGSTSVRAVEVRANGKAKPTLLRVHEIPMPLGAVSRGEVLEPNTVATALRELWASGGFSSKRVVLGVGNQRVLARDLSVPKMSLKRIREALPFQVQDMLPVPVADALLDFYPVSESQGENGPMVHGLLIAAVKDAVLGTVRAVQAAGLTPVGVDLIPFALSRVLISRPELKGTVVLIDVSANTTSVVIAIDGVPQFVRLVPAGGDDLTEALKLGLEVDATRAQELKESLGLSSKPKTEEESRAAAIIFQTTGELLGSLRNTINYFLNSRPQQPVGQIILTGRGARLPGFAEALTDMTRIPVIDTDPFVSVSIAPKLNSVKVGGSRSTVLVALGLAVGGMA
ncbi:MAG: pilus assembly protein PilM [Microbacteriaceae bacterium]|nr:pilus assembly protein PilM [Microbacteriaceae bacterium]